MTDELKDLKHAFDTDHARKPEQAARDAAILAAMAAFDQENASQRQGSGVLERLKDIGNTVIQTIFGRRPMNTTAPNLKPYLLGGVSLAVISLAVLNVEHLQLMTPDVAEKQIAEIEQFKTAPATKTGRAGNEPSTSSEPAPAPGEGKIAGNKNQIIGGQRRENEADADLRSDDKLVLADKPSTPTNMGAAEQLPAAQPPLSKRKLSAGRNSARAPGSEDRVQVFAFRSAKEAGGVRARSKLAPAPAPVDRLQQGYYQDEGRDKFDNLEPNAVKQVRTEPVSTFSIDVDTASYAFMRASLNNGVLPQPNSVRVEELINYFPYDYELPDDRDAPFSTHATVMPTPWNTATKLLHIGIKGYELPKERKPRANLVFLIDTSGSMNAPNKLPLLVNSFKLLLNTMSPDDTVSIVTYAGHAGTVLKPTRASEKAEILASLDRLRSGGSTAGGEGIRQAYQLAEQSFDKSGVNRVILATDGDFNVGITNPEELKGFIERKRETGISLSVLGFGRGNYNDALMQTLAQNGNGNAAYIDTLSEARKVLVEEAGSTLFTIAKDVKIQIEFNPAVISEYRLIGYETRLLKREDFNNDRIDAGEIGAGHTVTAIYELTPVGSSAELVDSLRYQRSNEAAQIAGSGESLEYGFLKLRYKLPDADRSRLLSFPVSKTNEVDRVIDAGTEARFAASVAAFGQLLRGGRYTGSYSYDDVIDLAQSAKGADEFGYRAEFINLVRLAKSASALQPQ